MWFLERLREPSTLAGLSVIATLFGLPVGTIDVVGQVLGTGLAVAAIVKKEKGNA